MLIFFTQAPLAFKVHKYRFKTCPPIPPICTTSTPFRVATTDSVETTEEPGDVEDKMTKIANFANIDKIDDVDNVERDLEMVEGPLDVCEEYSACVVYLVSVSLR